MLLEAYKTYQIGLRADFGKLCHALHGAIRNGVITRFEYAWAQKVVGDTSELRDVHRVVVAPRTPPPQPKWYELGLDDFDALPNPKGVHNRRGKLQVMMREQRLTDDDLSDPISRVLRDNDIGKRPLASISVDMEEDEDDAIDPPLIIM